MRIKLAVAVLATLCGAALAESSGGPYVMRKDVVASGGSVAAAPPYTATVTAAQPGAGRQSGGSYVLTGGFHSPLANSARVFCDGFEAAACP